MQLPCCTDYSPSELSSKRIKNKKTKKSSLHSMCSPQPTQTHPPPIFHPGSPAPDKPMERGTKNKFALQYGTTDPLDERAIKDGERERGGPRERKWVQLSLSLSPSLSFSVLPASPLPLLLLPPLLLRLSCVIVHSTYNCSVVSQHLFIITHNRVKQIQHYH